MNEWINIKNRLPDDEDEILFFNILDKKVSIGYKKKGYFFDLIDFTMTPINITHWMPLPNPPEKEQMKFEATEKWIKDAAENETGIDTIPTGHVPENKMKRIYKYHVPIENNFHIEMPLGAHILSFQVQNEVAFIWALVEPKNKKVLRHFVLVGTGQEFDPSWLGYIGTIQTYQGKFVWHLFEKIMA